ncbi:hypothetical protein BFD15_10655 [Morganella morganii]|nr:hypothetical protein BFD15_10655 [Morganella morganii]
MLGQTRAVFLILGRLILVVSLVVVLNMKVVVIEFMDMGLILLHKEDGQHLTQPMVQQLVLKIQPQIKIIELMGHGEHLVVIKMVLTFR